MSNLIPKGFFGEEYAEDVAFVLKPTKVLGEVTSQYQVSQIIQTETFGRVVFQENLIYLADTGNEAIYEMYTHIPMQTGRPKERVLLIGAGDGFGIKRLLEYPTVKKVIAIDIDGDFVELANTHMPDGVQYKQDPRVEFLIEDGADYVRETKEKFDFVLVTVGDPFTVSRSMFNPEFMHNVTSILADDGIFAIDGFMPYYAHEDVLNYWDIFELVSAQFPITKIWTSTSPLMPGGLVSFVIGSKQDDPALGGRGDVPVPTTWYTPEIHKAAFVLPQFMKDKLKDVPGFVQ